MASRSSPGHASMWSPGGRRAGLVSCPHSPAGAAERDFRPWSSQALESEEDRQTHGVLGSTGCGTALLALLSFLSLLFQGVNWWLLVGYLTNLTRSGAEMDFPSPYMST